MLTEFETTLDIGGGVNFKGRVDYTLSHTGQPENVKYSVGGGFCGYAGHELTLLLPADGAKIVEINGALNQQCADQLAQRAAQHAESLRPPQPVSVAPATTETPAPATTTENKPPKAPKSATVSATGATK
jgi:hypothetical protein